MAGWPDGRGRVAGWPWPGGRGCVAGCPWPGGRVAGWPDGRVAGWPDGWVGGWVGGCGRAAVAGWPVGRDLWVGRRALEVDCNLLTANFKYVSMPQAETSICVLIPTHMMYKLIPLQNNTITPCSSVLASFVKALVRVKHCHLDPVSEIRRSK